MTRGLFLGGGGGKGGTTSFQIFGVMQQSSPPIFFVKKIKGERIKWVKKVINWTVGQLNINIKPEVMKVFFSSFYENNKS